MTLLPPAVTRPQTPLDDVRAPRGAWAFAATFNVRVHWWSLVLFVATGACVSSSQKIDTPAPLTSPQIFNSDLYVQKGDQSFKLKCDMSLITAQAVRLDVTTTLDLPLASIILTDKKIEYALYRDKKFYSGYPNVHALDPVFPLTVDVATLSAILTEQAPVDSQCTATDEVRQCTGQAGNGTYKVSWSKRAVAGPLSGRSTRLLLELPERHVSLKFVLTGWQKSVSNAERLLTLSVPVGFKTFAVPH